MTAQTDFPCQELTTEGGIDFYRLYCDDLRHKSYPHPPGGNGQGAVSALEFAIACRRASILSQSRPGVARVIAMSALFGDVQPCCRVGTGVASVSSNVSHG